VRLPLTPRDGASVETTAGAGSGAGRPPPARASSAGPDAALSRRRGGERLAALVITADRQPAE
jgi:hypothetical protein